MTHSLRRPAAVDLPVVDQLGARLRAPDYQQWRAQVQATGGCAAPIHLTGSTQILDRDGAVLVERAGTVLAPCGNRRAALCPACSDRYAADAYHLLRAGLAGDESKGVPDTVTEHPRAFLTLTAPSFGHVHTRTVTRRGHVVPCRCGERHHPADPRIATPVDPDSYDYDGAVLWQAHAGALWARFTTTVRRALAAALGIGAREFGQHARLSYAKVAEYQRRGLVHFHAVIRLDGTGGPADPPPSGLTHEVMRTAITSAARAAQLITTRQNAAPLVLGWGAQLDLRPVTPTAARHLEDETGQITDAALAGYIAKYATKSTGAVDGGEGADRPIRDGEHIAHLDVSPHHRRMINTAWQLGGLVEYADLNLRRWAHMLGFRGHFMTKSRSYSVTFTAIRSERRTWRLRTDLDQLARETDDPGHALADLDTITVINDWRVVHIGHHDHAERELALAIAARQCTQGRTTRITRRAAA
ncbi:replication initiator [Pseudonocardia charpentierae]|uniref:Replication initiation protein n=1 Tax=Pseudonocardia charpentierae TaxID=3075545 RepID=A0ABU2NDR0_9PSEU|nr:replication initiator [Pseudonocardia sp. DSM 45834]MDT0351717.1 replication initiation protein [Pseudonocardia sp. DSM 45834]